MAQYMDKISKNILNGRMRKFVSFAHDNAFVITNAFMNLQFHKNMT